MTCPDYNWKDFVLGETPAAQTTALEQHLASCADCRAEVDSLRLTLVALHRLPAREMPRRISFVSDPVFEPSFWQRFWNSGPRLAFASSALLAGAILIHAFAPGAPSPQTAPISQAQFEDRVRQEVAARLPGAVRESIRVELQPALNELSARIDQMDKTRLAGIERRVEQQRQSDLRTVESAFNYMEKRLTTLMNTNVRYGGD
jgi:anti-sigma factor RsiW